MRTVSLVWDIPISRYLWTIHQDGVPEMMRVEFCLSQVMVESETLKSG